MLYLQTFQAHGKRVPEVMSWILDTSSTWFTVDISAVKCCKSFWSHEAVGLFSVAPHCIGIQLEILRLVAVSPARNSCRPSLKSGCGQRTRDFTKICEKLRLSMMLDRYINLQVDKCQGISKYNKFSGSPACGLLMQQLLHTSTADNSLLNRIAG